MPWFRVDDNLALHTKVLTAGNGAMGLWVRAGSWSMQQLTDGHIPTQVARQLGTRAEASRLVAAGLWVEAEGGYDMAERSIWSGIVGDYRPRISDELRAAVYARDGHACLHCGTTGNLSLDHIYPYSLGGDDVLDNLQTLCRPCNSRKGARV